MDELKSPGKPFEVSKQAVWEAYQKVRRNKGAAGVDGQSLAEFENDEKKQPVPDMEPDVVGQLLPAAGPSRGDPQARGPRGPDTGSSHRV